MARAGDKAGTRFFSSDRFFSANDQWFFSTRETPDQGPFPSRAAAEAELNAYLRTQIRIPGQRLDPWDDPTRLR